MSVPKDPQQTLVLHLRCPRSILTTIPIQNILDIPYSHTLVVARADEESTSRIKSQCSNESFVPLQRSQTFASVGRPDLDLPVVGTRDDEPVLDEEFNTKR